MEAKKDAVDRVTDPNQSLAKMLKDAMPELRNLAPKYVNILRMTSLAIEAKMRNPLLEKCSPVSVLNFCKRCAEAGTDRIGAGGMWAVPFWDKKTGTYNMVPMPDWRLIVEKAKKAKAITHATAEAVYENDVFEYERGMNPALVHKPALSDRGKLKAVYCVYVLQDGTKDFTVMDIAEDIEAIRKRSKSADDGPWVTDYAEMAKKTVVKRAMKTFEGASIELTALIAADNVVTGYIDAEIVEPRAPVAMPRELPEATEYPQAHTDQSQAMPAEAPPAADGEQTADVVLGACQQKSGKGAKGPWTRFYTQADDGQYYSTFDTKIGAKMAEMDDQPVSILFKLETTAKGTNRTILDIQPVILLGQIEPGDARE